MLGLELLAAHMVGDFVLQTDHMASRKLSDWRVRLSHVAAYSAPFLVVMLAYVGEISRMRVFAFYILLVVSHFILDSRRWASGEVWAPKPIVVDQTLHIVTLAVIGRLLMP